VSLKSNKEEEENPHLLGKEGGRRSTRRPAYISIFIIYIYIYIYIYINLLGKEGEAVFDRSGDVRLQHADLVLVFRV